jgi:hypothetical protein
LPRHLLLICESIRGGTRRIESVVDYAFYQAQYLSDIKTEAEYLQYLKANYAEDPNYMAQLQVIIDKQKGNKNLFKK